MGNILPTSKHIDKKTVLLLIKNKNNYNLLTKLLRNKFNIVIKKDNYYKKRIDLVILDDYYFKKHYKKIGRIKEEEKPNYLPILLLTNERIAKQKPRNFSEYIDEVMIKPIDKKLILKRVKNLLKTRNLSLLGEKNNFNIAENSPVGIVIIDETEIMYANPMFTKIINEERLELIKKNIYNYVDKSYHLLLEEFINEKINETKDEFLEIKLKNDNQTRWVEVRGTKFIYQGLEAKLLIFSDITEKKKTSEKIRHLSFHDKLTNLYNRAFFEEELKRLNVKRQLPLSIIMGDINGLKMVNDAFSHSKGDQLLQEISEIMLDSIRKEDIVSRLGGDEFGILLPKTDQKEADKIRRRIAKKCKKAKNIIGKHSIELSIALGIATKTNENQNIDQVFITAEDNMYRNKISGSNSVRHSIMTSLENTLQEKTHETKEHAERMEKLSIKLGKKLNLSLRKLDELKLLARLHDIGKVAIPERILKKPGKLTDKEYEIIKNHPESGYRIVKSVPSLAYVAEGVLCHHERWDGKGYPQGKAGESIPYIARIIAIIDTYDVMTHNRAYKEAESKQKALLEIEENAGTQFDPNLVEEFLDMMR